ncbi:MAG: tubulin/FtsZ family protein [Dehalococcoidales bacterium]|jgi:cell division GTPase FtsZ|nr:tubulin/FtsZ family protein [Dehalococcoidales bacterium]
MKLTVIGFGQCGGRIADEFARINARAISHRGTQITPGVYAVNTDSADLTGLHHIKADYQHRILIGGRKTGGHGVGKLNEIGAKIAREDSDKIFEAIISTRHLFETDAFLLIASGGGGTGSGAIAVMTRLIKERFDHKPVYDMIILPFEHEELTEERATYNTALCLKTVNSIADAVILVDNQRYIKEDASLKSNFTEINRLIVEPFFDLLCAGEETKTRFIGAKTLDAGDIMQTLTGWTAIGYGKEDVPMFNFPFRRSGFRSKIDQTYKGIQAMEQAISRLSVDCNPGDASRALYLLSAPAGEMSMYIVKEIGEYLRNLAPRATIRNGDYPRERRQIEVNVIISGLNNIEKVKNFYLKSLDLIPEFQRRQEENEEKLKEMEETGKGIPSLLQ